MSDSKKYENYAYYSEIKKIEFYILGSEENYIDSAVSVTNKESFKGELPVENGVYSSAMGTTEYTYNCSTCLQPKKVCPNHSGSLDLSYPVKSPLFRDYILKWLKIVCFKCGNLLVDKDVNIASSKVLNEYVKLSKDVEKCPWKECGEVRPRIYKDKYEQAVFYAEYKSAGKKTRKEELYNHIIRNILSKISNDTVLKMQKPIKCHPRNFILDIMRVPPNAIRPDIRKIGGTRSNNSGDITALTKNIVEINEMLPMEIPPVNEISKELRETYFNLDITYFEMIKGASASNNQVRIVTSSNKVPSSIASRLPKKLGRFRNNLMGKRCWYMSRSVITGDNTLRVDELGFPIKIARSLQIPETVRVFNRDRLNIYYINKRNIYPGCSGIYIKGSNKFHRIEHLDPTYELREGDIVMRDIIEGDVVGFNRQPSLLFGQISSHRVKIMKKGSTFRINVSACSVFNADFDGDQANALIAQNIQSRTELQKMSWIGNWMISYQNYSPYFGNYMDSLIGSAELTRSDVFMDKWHAMMLFSNVTAPADDNFNFDKLEYSGRSLIGKFMPKINFPKKKASFYMPQYAAYIDYDPKEIYVQINRGELISGSLDKSTVGQQVMGSIFHIINNEYGADAALETIYNFHQITTRFFYWKGFTVGIEDVNISEPAMIKIREQTAAMEQEAQMITDKLNRRELVAPLGMKLSDFYEMEILNALEPADSFVIPILADIDFKKNKLANLIFTGSKGKKTNLININGSYGQITINGRRPPRNFSWGRTSPYFLRNDSSSESQGFVRTSYREGISSMLFPFAASDARFSSISNALSTSVSGAQSRVSVKNLESIITNNLRQSAKEGNVVQILYADSGIDVRRTESVKFLTSMISDTDMESQYKVNSKRFASIYHNDTVDKILYQEYEQLLTDRLKYREIFFWAENNNPGQYLIDDRQQMPINPYRIIEDIIYNYEDVIENLDKEQKVLDPVRSIKKVRELCDSIGYSYFNVIYEEKQRHIPAHIEEALTLTKILIRTYLCTANLLRKNINNYHLDLIIAKIKITFKNSLIDYGVAVGIIAAQCLSEPLTQYVLNSKHRSGTGEGTSIDTVARVKEILGAKDTISMKDPRMLIMVKAEYEKNKPKVQEIANYIEMMNFERFISVEQIFFEKYGNPKHPNYIHEIEMIRSFEKKNAGIKIPTNLMHWCIRFELNKEELLINNMKLSTIVTKLKMKYPELFIVYSPETSNTIVMRCYFTPNIVKTDINVSLSDVKVIDIMNKITGTIIRGVKNIKYTEIVKVARSEINDDGSISSTNVFGISTKGTNLEDVLDNPYVDIYRTQTNSIQEFEEMYGVEAARNKIIIELRKAMSSDNVIKEQCSIFADEMTTAGYVSSIQKTGLQAREMNNVTLRLSFQSPIQVLEQAAVNGVTDTISAVSGPLIVGQAPVVGTTYNNVFINEKFISEHMQKMNEKIEDEL